MEVSCNSEQELLLLNSKQRRSAKRAARRKVVRAVLQRMLAVHRWRSGWAVRSQALAWLIRQRELAELADAATAAGEAADAETAAGEAAGAAPSPLASPQASPAEPWLLSSPERAALVAQECARPGCGRPCADVADKAHRMYGYCGDECMRAQERLDQERRIQELKDQGMLVRRVVRRIA